MPWRRFSRAGQLGDATGDFRPLHEAFVAAVGLARSGRELWRIAVVEPIDETFFSEEELVRPQLEAILDKARGWDQAADIAAALALACRATATHPGRQLLDPEDAGVKTDPARVLDDHMK